MQTSLILFIFCTWNVYAQYYTAAAVEYYPRGTTSLQVNRTQAQGIMMQNVNMYHKIIQDSLQSNPQVQIFTFPEYGLYGPVILRSRDTIRPYAEEIPNMNGVNPCELFQQFQERPILHALSCLAKKFGVILVVSMADSQRNGTLLYNTQVALDRDGTLLAKYHKTHLYYEQDKFDAGDGKAVYFDSYFGVRFGMMICFDMIFGSPIQDLLVHQVTDIVFSTWWVNFPPMINALQVQQSWSQYFRVNLLAANAGTGW